MANLNINLNTAPATPSGKTTANKGTAEAAPESSFGNVLARQIQSDAPANGSVATDARATKLLKDVSKDSKLVADNKSNDPSAPVSDLTANLIAMLQPAQESRPPLATALQTEAAIVRADPKALPLTASGKTALVADTREPLTAGKAHAAVDTTPSTATNTQIIQAASSNEDITKLTEAKLLISPDTQSHAPLAQDVAAFNAPALGATPSSAQTTPSAPVTVATPMGSSVWADDFAQQVTWMATGKQEQTASLHLNPPNLGPLEVVVKVSDNQATVLFTSPHGAVREAIENALPKLRELMADNGITLGNTSVSDQAPRERNETNDNGAARRNSWETTDSNSVDTPVRGASMQSAVIRHKGMVDTFA